MSRRVECQHLNLALNLIHLGCLEEPCGDVWWHMESPGPQGIAPDESGEASRLSTVGGRPAVAYSEGMCSQQDVEVIRAAKIPRTTTAHQAADVCWWETCTLCFMGRRVGKVLPDQNCDKFQVRQRGMVLQYILQVLWGCQFEPMDTGVLNY